jgi:hypothetical protein
MLAGSLTFLASLYLTWVSAGNPIRAIQTKHGALSLLNLFSNAFALNGWGVFGQAAAIAAVALGFLAVVSIIQPELESALPMGGCAIALAALALVNAAAVRTHGIYLAGYDGLSAHLSTGAYMGGAAALVALLSAAWVSHDEIPELWKAAAATLLTIGLVAAYVLPTLNIHKHAPTGLGAFDFVGIGSNGRASMLLIASFGLTFWFGATPPIRRISGAVVVLVLAVGGFSPYGTHAHWPYEAWLAIGCAAGLLILALATNGQLRVARPSRPYALALEGAFLLLVAEFFNWERSCSHSPEGTCFVFNGWSGGLTGGLVAVLVGLLLCFRRYAPELAVAVAIYVASSGLAITAHANLSYGAFLGFAGAALLLLAVALRPWKEVRASLRLVPVGVCVAFLAIPVATLSDRLSPRTELFGSWQLRLLEAAAIVLTLRLIGRWLRGPAADDELLLVPLALVAFTGLDFGERQHAFSISWEAWLSLALSLLLVALGWLGRRGGLADFRIPDEIWRVDRISAGED